jgi:hypothetical protein
VCAVCVSQCAWEGMGVAGMSLHAWGSVTMSRVTEMHTARRYLCLRAVCARGGPPW